jgi:redox-sensitive bicupin YhaK (pirin superfamily)
MLTLRKARDRGHANHGWLVSRHTFSFADYMDPAHMGFSVLRVINEDRVAPGQGFPTHGHRDMEIISYVLEGALSHKDSMGNGSVIRPGDVQRMSAGTGVTHSEYNGSEKEGVHFLQIWILPEKRGIAPGYEQKHFSEDDRRGAWRLVASPDAAGGSLKIHQDARIYSALVDGTLDHAIAPGRRAWLQVARGKVQVGELELREGDGLAVENEASLKVSGSGEALLFDLP